jgi:hypothetical protein
MVGGGENGLRLVTSPAVFFKSLNDTDFDRLILEGRLVLPSDQSGRASSISRLFSMPFLSASRSETSASSIGAKSP